MTALPLTVAFGGMAASQPSSYDSIALDSCLWWQAGSKPASQPARQAGSQPTKQSYQHLSLFVSLGGLAGWLIWSLRDFSFSLLSQAAKQSYQYLSLFVSLGGLAGWLIWSLRDFSFPLLRWIRLLLRFPLLFCFSLGRGGKGTDE